MADRGGFRRRALVAVAVMAIAGVGGCAGDGDSAAPTTAPASASDPASATVDPSRVTTVRSASGVEVEVPTGAATGGRLTVADAGEGPDEAADAPAPSPLSDAGAAVEVSLDGGDLTGSATIRFPLDDETAAQLPLVERFDESTRAWVTLPAESVTIDGDSVTVTTDRFSWYRPSWLSAAKVASALGLAWTAVFGDGLSDGEAPTCPRDADTLEQFRWDSSPEDTLLWCVGTNDDGTVIANVVNNNRYPMALAVSPGLRQMGKFGGSWSAAALGATFDEWGSGQIVLEAREGVTLTLDRGTEGTYSLSSDFTLLTWAIGMLGVAMGAYADILTRGGGSVETWRERLVAATALTACVGDLGQEALTAPEGAATARALVAMIFGCGGEIVQEAVADLGWWARQVGALLAFVTGPVIAAFEGLVALGELTVDSLARRATYDLSLEPAVDEVTYPITCNAVPDRYVEGAFNGVRVTGPGATCEEADRVVDRYIWDDTLPPPEGSSGFREVERWTCFSDTIASENGSTGGCSLTEDDSQGLIEIYPI